MQLVLLHALPFDGTMWANDMDLLPGNTIAPNLYAFGESIEDWGRAVLELATEEELVVVGNSVGGSTALEIARQAPSRVKAVVVIGAKAGVRPDAVFRDEAVRTLLEGGMPEAWPKYWAGLFGANADRAVIERARSLACSQDIDDVIRGVRAFHNRHDLTEFARSWQRPLVVIRGSQDGTPPHSSAIELASSTLGELHTVGDAGHYTSLEQPSTVHAIIRNVLSRLSGP